MFINEFGFWQRLQRTQGKERHGLLKDGDRPPEHGIWKMMIQKCYNPDSGEFKNYGTCDIRVCDRWRARDGLPHGAYDTEAPSWLTPRLFVFVKKVFARAFAMFPRTTKAFNRFRKR